MRRSTPFRRSLIPAVLLLAVLSACTDAPADSDPVSDGAGVATSAPASPEATDAAGTDADAETASDDTADSGTENAGTGTTGNTGNTGNTGGQTAAPSAAPSTAPTTAPAAVTLALVEGKCQSGAFKVTVTAAYDGTYRKGITGVKIERQNEYNSWISATATWLGPETGQGNQWTGSAPGSSSQRFKDTVRITATATGGATATTTTTVTGSC